MRTICCPGSKGFDMKSFFFEANPYGKLADRSIKSDNPSQRVKIVSLEDTLSPFSSDYKVRAEKAHLIGYRDMKRNMSEEELLGIPGVKTTPTDLRFLLKNQPNGHTGYVLGIERGPLLVDGCNIFIMDNVLLEVEWDISWHETDDSGYNSEDGLHNPGWLLAYSYLLQEENEVRGKRLFYRVMK